MQILDASPRDAFSVEQVSALLTDPAVAVDFGADQLDASLNFRANLTPDLIDGSVSRQMYATIHGTCDLQLSRALAWGVALMPKEYATLNAWAGQVVLYRDENGTRLWSVYLGTPWKSLVTYGTSWRQVDLAIQAG